MRIKFFIEHLIEKSDKETNFFGVDIFILPCLKFYYEFTPAVYDNEMKFEIYFAFLFWTFDLQFLHTDKHENEN